MDHSKNTESRRTLSNGLRILAHHDPTARTCFLRLVVRVGSLDEDDSEVGIAHFIEHCGFRGTRTHENGTLHKFVESLGSRFGADLNAKTGLTETIWMLNVPLRQVYPNNDDENRLVESLRVLGEWAHSIRFSEQDVEAERAVILEEYRMKRGSAQRLKDTYWRQVMPQVGARIPIGTVESIKSLTTAQLKTFYAETYCMERMALVVVGNLNSLGEIDGLVTNLESHSLFVPPVGSAEGSSTQEDGLILSKPFFRQRIPFRMPQRKPIACVIPEKELSSTMISIEIYKVMDFDFAEENGFLKREVVKRVFSSVLEARLRELSYRPRSQDSTPGLEDSSNDVGPFVSAGVSCRLAFHDLATECTSVTGQCHRIVGDEDESTQIRAVVHALLREMVRLSKFGITDDEVEFAKQKWRHVFRRKLRPSASRDEICNEICEEYIQHFILEEKPPLLAYDEEARLALYLLDPVSLRERDFPVITSADVTNFAQDTFSHLIEFSESMDWNTVVVLQGQHCSSFNDKKLANLVKDCLHEHLSDSLLKPWVFHRPLDSTEEIGRALLPLHYDEDAERQEGTTKWRCIDMTETQAKCFVLSNGLKVCVKDTASIHPQKLSFQAFALGGCSVLNDQEDVAFGFLSSTLQASGLGVLDDLSLSRVESRHQTSVRFQQHWFHRGIGGSCASEKIELLLQMIVALLLGVDPSNKDLRKRLDKPAFERHRRIALDNLANQVSSDSPELRFAEKIRKTMIGESETVFRPLRKEVLESINIGMLEALYFDAFTRDPASEFTFVFCGDVLAHFGGAENERFEALGNLLERYLGAMLQRTNIPSERWSKESRLPRHMRLAFPSTDCVELFTYEKVEEEKDAESPEEGDSESAKAQIIFGHLVQQGWEPDQELETELDLRIACSVAQIRLLERLRTEQSVIYTVDVDHSRNSLSKFGLVFTSMSCKTQHAEKVLGDVFALYEEMGRDKDILSVACSSVEKQLQEWHYKASKNNSYWLFWLLDAWKRAMVQWPESDNAEVLCASVDNNASQVACPDTFSSRVQKRLGTVDSLFSRYFTQRVAICMLRDEVRRPGKL